jgi:hypothetical protein
MIVAFMRAGFAPACGQPDGPMTNSQDRCRTHSGLTEVDKKLTEVDKKEIDLRQYLS